MAILKIKNHIIKILFSYDWGVVEIQGALFKISWGIWLLMPFQTFRTIQGYNALGNENTWGWVLLSLGVLHMAAINQKVMELRKNMTFLAFLFWIFTVILIYNQSHTAGLIPTFSIIAFFMGVNYLRLRAIVKSERKERRIVNLGNPDGVERRLKHE